MLGGEDEIRTHGTVARTHAFQACSFSHSDTSPYKKLLYPTLVLLESYRSTLGPGAVTFRDPTSQAKRA